MISNKPLFAIVVMALTLARAAPLHDVNEIDESQFTELLPEHLAHHSHGDLGNHSMKLYPSEQNHHSHQAKVLLPKGDNYSPTLSDEIPSNGEELAENVVAMRDYIETLTDDEFDYFIDQYIQNASKGDMFALELALDLDADERDDEDDFNNEELWDGEDDEDDEETVHFVPFGKASHVQKSHRRQHPHNHRLQHRFDQEVGCDEEEIKLGLCEPSLEFSQHAHRHHHHSSHGEHHHQGEKTKCSSSDMGQGLCEVDEERSEHHHHRHPHLRHGEVIGEEITYASEQPHHHHHLSHHDQSHHVLTGADGFPFGLGNGHHIHHQEKQDEDLLGSKIDSISQPQSSLPIGMAIIQQADSLPVPASAPAAKPAVEISEVVHGHPVKVAELHVEGASMLPRVADELSNEDLVG